MKLSAIRLQKFLAENTDLSRRKAEECIEKGQVFVNGKKATLGQKVLGNEAVFLKGKPVKSQEKMPTLIAFYKPEGVECTYQKNDSGKTLADFDFGKNKLFNIGRLDKDSKGLLLLTNDGEFANRLMHPRYEHEKEYLVVVDKKMDDETILKLGNGSISIDGKKVRPCRVQKISGKIFTIVLKEGRNRQIRRMCEACGLTVRELLRTRIGTIQLGKLSEGTHRPLKIDVARKAFGL